MRVEMIKLSLALLFLTVSCGPVQQAAIDKINSIPVSGTATSTSTSTDVTSQLGVCDAKALGDVKQIDNQMYFCSSSKQWEKTKVSTCQDNCDNTVIINGNNNNVVIGSNSTDTNTSTETSTDKTDKTQRKWILGNTISSDDLFTDNKDNIFSKNFLCPEGYRSPSLIDYKDGIANEDLLTFIGNQFVIVGVTKTKSNDHYLIVVGTASAEFMVVTPLDLSEDGKALCVSVQ